MPLETIEAYRDHGKPAARLGENLSQARKIFESLPALGVDIDAVCRKLENEGIDKFNQPFDKLLREIELHISRAKPGRAS
jgi:transaldolase/transaldolase/glucose-6-phosphate isomerase